ncbi:MAG: MarR family transcriptional regulator [Candidatus Bipolaricaulota bacterium]
MTQRHSPLPGEGITQTVYALTECIQRRLLTHFAGTGLHWGLKRILQKLWIADGLSQAELAKAVRSSEASASNMLKHLVSGGWVERRRDPFDYRISRVFLTEQGKAMRDAVEEECSRIEAELRGVMGAGDADTLHILLKRALDGLRPASADEDVSPTGIYDAPGPPGGL